MRSELCFLTAFTLGFFFFSSLSDEDESEEDEESRCFSFPIPANKAPSCLFWGFSGCLGGCLTSSLGLVVEVGPNTDLAPVGKMIPVGYDYGYTGATFTSSFLTFSFPAYPCSPHNPFGAAIFSSYPGNHIPGFIVAGFT